MPVSMIMLTIMIVLNILLLFTIFGCFFVDMAIVNRPRSVFRNIDTGEPVCVGRLTHGTSAACKRFRQVQGTLSSASHIG